MPKTGAKQGDFFGFVGRQIGIAELFAGHVTDLGVGIAMLEGKGEALFKMRFPKS